MNDASVRDRILDEATRLFGRQGYGATSMRELAEAVGVTKPTLYYWFSNKEGVFEAAVARQVDQLRGLLADVFEADGDAVAKLHRFCERYVMDGIADADGVRLFLSAEGPREEGRPEIDLLAIHHESLTAIQQLLAEGVGAGRIRADLDPVVAALSLLGMLNMHILGALHGLDVPDDLPQRVLRIFLSGVATS